MRGLIVVALVLLLANAGWWLLRAEGTQVDVPTRDPAGPGAVPAMAAPPPVGPAAAAETAPRLAAPPAVPEPVSAAAAGAGGPGGLLVPVQGIEASQLLDTFGDARGAERSHEALDIMAAPGTPVLAVADGHVEKLFDSERGGLTIYQFEPSGRWCYYYAHLQAYAPGLAEGAPVRRGEVIGYVGSSGNADPAAPHLHFAVFALTPERQWWTGTPLNPYPLLAAPQQ